MFEQLTQLVQQYGQEAVVKNNAIPNEQNEAVMNEASNSILDGLKNMVAQGNVSDLAGLIQGKSSVDSHNPIVQKLTEHLSANLGQKFGLSSDTAAGVSENMLPKVIGSLIGNAKDPNYKGFEVSDLVKAISGGNGNSSLMDAVSKYGGQFGLDQNADGKVDMSDAMAAVTKKGGIGGFLGKLFGK